MVGRQLTDAIWLMITKDTHTHKNKTCLHANTDADFAVCKGSVESRHRKDAAKLQQKVAELYQGHLFGAAIPRPPRRVCPFLAKGIPVRARQRGREQVIMALITRPLKETQTKEHVSRQETHSTPRLEGMRQRHGAARRRRTD